MLDRSEFMPIAYLKKAKFTGSFKGMRFRMEMASRQVESGEESREETGLLTSSWPEPYSFDATKPEFIRQEWFSFDEEGIKQGVHWLNEVYEERKNK
ncbi:MAG: hypothetical protein ACLSX5_07240 [Lachnospiraceae bacterium]